VARSKRVEKEDKKKYYCRKCMDYKTDIHFYKATDFFLDSNGFMSICKECIEDIYNSFFVTEGTMEKTILRMCKILNIRYDESAIESTKRHMQTYEERGTELGNIFGIYKSKLGAQQSTQIGSRNTDEDLTYVEPSLKVIESIPIKEIPDIEYYEDTWGKSDKFTIDDYEYLETEFSRWKRTTKCDTQPEIVLVREICHIQNEIRKARIEGTSYSNLVKQLQEVMKNSALTPALQNAVDSNKFADSFGVWIKDIENKTPAEWWKDQTKYKDMDGIEEDRKDILRSIRNFIVGSRDFNTVELEAIGMSEEIEEGE